MSRTAFRTTGSKPCSERKTSQRDRPEVEGKVKRTSRESRMPRAGGVEISDGHEVVEEHSPCLPRLEPTGGESATEGPGEEQVCGRTRPVTEAHPRHRGSRQRTRTCQFCALKDLNKAGATLQGTGEGQPVLAFRIDIALDQASLERHGSP